MIALLDVNLLVAIAWPEHIFHAEAIRWFDRRAEHGWATCGLTESGFLRISANPKVVGDAVRPAESADLLRRLFQFGDHHFWIDDVQPTTSSFVPLERLIGHRQVTDAQLLGLSRRHQGSLASFDRGLNTLARGLADATIEIVE
jgi:uncharacterized protein